jgi:hypothetical protein
MNLPQELINILAGLAFSVGGWFARLVHFHLMLQLNLFVL